MFDDFEQTVQILNSMPKLRSLYINLHEESQVDLIMRNLKHLEFLNGLKVEQELLEVEEGHHEEHEDGEQV
eukprot:CAMPEP_0116880608 /NCGR_PEP_ID=MMETSP0463-20121206/12538_1 /TAXON_ID=181622 /ORGANISM="Strombidinopsis sp, Strain SopsisLIS2011" /LENGTH=70 /DNA_ID=CAMNT_0004531359 /DNA_START=297 /DNA_END=509 /DNA_ORIENTATION=-